MYRVMKQGIAAAVVVFSTTFCAFAGQFDGVATPSDWEAISPPHHPFGKIEQPKQQVFVNKSKVQNPEPGVYGLSLLVFTDTPVKRGYDGKLHDAVFYTASVNCNTQRYEYEWLGHRLRQPEAGEWYEWDWQGNGSAKNLDWRILNPKKMDFWTEFMRYHFCGPSDLKQPQ